LERDKIKVWGIVPTLNDKPRKEWLELQEGDLVLFYAKKRFFYGAKVAFKIQNKSLAGELWGYDDQGRTWEYIYFIKEGKEIDTQYLPELIGYKPNHILMGAILLNEDKSVLLKKYIEKNEGKIIDESIIKPKGESRKKG